jgi:Xaa-Pro dipeptidase
MFNIERARELMADAAVEAMVASCGENLTWSTGYANWTVYTYKDQEVYGVLSRNGRSALVVPIDAADYLAEEPTTADSIYTYGTYYVLRNEEVELTGAEARLFEIRDSSIRVASAAEGLQRALADLGVTGGQIAIDERGMPPSRWRSLTAQLEEAGISAIEGMELFRKVRRVKTEDEIEKLRTAVRAVEAGMEAVFQRLASGVTEAELESVFRSTVAATGVAPGHYETTAGGRGGGCFPASQTYQLQPGDVIRSDCGGRFKGYHADTGRTAVLGEASELMKTYFAAIQTGIDVMLDMVRPGVRPSQLFNAGVDAVVKAGIPHYRRHHAGHGIGLEMYEVPLLVPASSAGGIHAAGEQDVPLEVGMVINVELPYYEVGRGGLQIEDTVVVRPNGYELLTGTDRAMYHARV